MANYCCVTRTNYFHVKSESKFRDLMSHVYGSEDSVDLWEEKDSDGKTVFAFGTYGGIAGIGNASEDEDDCIDECSYDEFINGLQACVADDDAIIITESGNEKMRYVVGSAMVITSSGYKYMDISDVAIHAASEMLGNPNWSTRCDY